MNFKIIIIKINKFIAGDFFAGYIHEFFSEFFSLNIYIIICN